MMEENYIIIKESLRKLVDMVDEAFNLGNTRKLSVVLSKWIFEITQWQCFFLLNSHCSVISFYFTAN